MELLKQIQLEEKKSGSASVSQDDIIIDVFSESGEALDSQGLIK